VSPDVTRRLGGEVAARGAAMLDAPVSGSPITLEAGQLAFMVGGDPAVLERVRPYLLAIGPTITHVGPLGLAVTMKIDVNLGLVHPHPRGPQHGAWARARSVGLRGDVRRAGESFRPPPEQEGMNLLS